MAGSPALRRSAVLRRVLVLVAAALGGALLVLGIRSERLPDLTAARLASARARWQAAPLPAYRLVLETEGAELTKGTYEVEVRDGKPVRVTRDGQAITAGDASFYTVEGLLATLDQELALAADPVRSYGAPPGYRMYLFAAFDGKRGTPLRFRRVVGGTSKWAEWRVLRLDPA